MVPPRRRRRLLGRRGLGAVLVPDLALGGFLQGHGQVVLRARLDERGREVVEGALAELMMVVVDLSRALGGDDHERAARVDILEQLVDAWRGHDDMAPARWSSRSTMPVSSATACCKSLFSTTWS